MQRLNSTTFINFSIASAITLFATGCAQQLSEQGRMVREVQADYANSCEFLGVLEATEGYGWDIVAQRRGALNRLRDTVGQSGGNAFVITNMDSNIFRTHVQADGYKCP